MWLPEGEIVLVESDSPADTCAEGYGRSGVSIGDRAFGRTVGDKVYFFRAQPMVPQEKGCGHEPRAYVHLVLALGHVEQRGPEGQLRQRVPLDGHLVDHLGDDFVFLSESPCMTNLCPPLLVPVRDLAALELMWFSLGLRRPIAAVVSGHGVEVAIDRGTDICSIVAFCGVVA